MNAPMVEWGIAEQPYPGESRSGDSHVIVQSGNRAIVAVIDGIGHGDEAAEAATAAVDIIEKHADEPVDRLIRRCHERLSRTRGAAMTLAVFNGDDSTLTWLGAGNVLASLLRGGDVANGSCSDLLVRGGVVGAWLPHLHLSSVTVARGDVLVLATDGIDANFMNSVRARENLQRQADRILANHQNTNDDALVLVVRFNGASGHNDERE